jgi:hypothetical protein
MNLIVLYLTISNPYNDLNIKSGMDNYDQTSSHHVLFSLQFAKMKLVNTMQVYPIRGKRYKCQDCTELIGFDLCEACYNSSSKLPGRFNQRHTPNHRMEVDNSALVHRILRHHGIPEEGPEGLMMEVVGPDAMVQILIDNQGMEEGNDEGPGEAAIEEPVGSLGSMSRLSHLFMYNPEMEDGNDEDSGEEAAIEEPVGSLGAMAPLFMYDQEMEDNEEDQAH